MSASKCSSLISKKKASPEVDNVAKEKFPDHKVPALVELPGFLGQLLCFHELGLIESPSILVCRVPLFHQDSLPSSYKAPQLSPVDLQNLCTTKLALCCLRQLGILIFRHTSKTM